MALQHVLADFPDKISLHGTAKYRLHACILYNTKMSPCLQQHVHSWDCFKDILFCFFADATVKDLEEVSGLLNLLC